MSVKTCCGTDEKEAHRPDCQYSRPIRVLSFGAGTQSSAVLELIEQGKIPPVDFAVFADTQCEPKEVYDWLEKIKAWAKTPIIIATKGNLYEDALACANGESTRFSAIPFHTYKHIQFQTMKYVETEDGGGILKRQCTADYKIEVVQQAVRKQLGYKPHQWMRHKVEMLIAMSLEEVGRMRDSREKWIKNVYPLIFDVPMHRQQSIEYVKTLGLGTPPRSSCLMCPLHSNEEWRHIRETDKESWEKAIAFDKACRQLPRMKSETFLHPSLKPLDEVDLDAPDPQLDMFQNDCSGMCGA